MSGSVLITSRVAGLLAGLGLVGLLALQAWRIPASARPAAVAVDLRAVPTGEVGVSPVGALLAGESLTPGSNALRGSARLQNRTAGRLVAAARVTGGDPALDRLVDVELGAGGVTVFRGPLGDLREGARARVTLPRAASARVEVALRLPGAAGGDAIARSARWTLTFSGARR